MQFFFKTVSLLLLLFCLSANAIEIFEIRMNVKSAEFGLHQFEEIPRKTHQIIPNVNVSFIDELTSSQRYVWKITNNGRSPITQLRIGTYADIEIEENDNTFFNESAEIDNLVAPDNLNVAVDHILYTAQSWSAGEPGYYEGSLRKQFAEQLLPSQNYINPTDDVAVAFSHTIPELASGDTALVALYIGDETVQGIKQKDLASNTSVYINSIAMAPKINVVNNQPPIANNDAYTSEINETVELSPLANDSDPDGDQISIIQLNGVALTGDQQTIQHGNGKIHIDSAGKIHFIPNNNYTGDIYIPYKIVDSKNAEATATIKITVKDAVITNRPPVARDDNYQTTRHQTVELSPLTNDSDPDGDIITLTEIAGTTITGLEQSIDISEGRIKITHVGMMTFLPNLGFAGAVKIPYRIVDDKGLAAEADIHIMVQPQTINRAPVAVDDAYTVEENQTITLNPLINDSDPDGDAIRLISINGQSSGIVNLANGQVDISRLSFTPSRGFSGNVRFGYEITDGKGGSDSAFISIEVKKTTPKNEPPIALDDNYTTIKNTIVTLTPLANDTDPDGDVLSIQLINNQPVNLTSGQYIVLSNGGIIVGASTLQFEPSKDFVGEVSIPYSIVDSQGLGASANIIITVEEQPTNNLPPIARDDFYQMLQGEVVTLTPLNNDSHPQGHTIKLAKLNGQVMGAVNNTVVLAQGTFERLNEKEIRFTPNDDYSGTLIIDYEIEDNFGLISSAQIHITVGSMVVPEKIPSNTLWGLIFLLLGLIVLWWQFAQRKVTNQNNIRLLQLVLIVMLSLNALPLAYGQNTNPPPATSIDNRGKEFYVTFMKNWNGTSLPKLFATAGQAGTVRVKIDAINYDESFNLLPDQPVGIVLPVEAQLDLPGIKQQMAIHVTSNVDIALYGISQLQYTTDAFLAIPTKNWGTEYYAISYSAISQQLPSEFAVIALEDNTFIQVTLPESAQHEAVNSVYTEYLNKGDIYYYEYGVDDVTGVKISANNPIGVFSGISCTYIPIRDRFCDHLIEQVPSIDQWGSVFATIPLKTRVRGDRYRLLAAHDNTKVSFNHSPLFTLNAGEVYEWVAKMPQYIETSKPALLAQYSHGSSYDSVKGTDPFMTLVTPLDQTSNRYVIATPSGSFIDDKGKNYLNVVTHRYGIDTFILDNQALDQNLFTPIEGTLYATAQLEINDASHTIASDYPFALTSYGYAEFESYGYPGGAVYRDNSTDFFPKTCLHDIQVRTKPGKVQLFWQNSGAFSYEVYRSEAYNGNYSKVATTRSNYATILDTPPTTQKNYFYEIRELDSLGLPRCRSARVVGYMPNYGDIYNLPPRFTSTAVTSSLLRGSYNYQVTAKDPENGSLSFALQEAPTGMQIDASGKITWTTDVPGIYPVSISVTDDKGAKALQGFELTIIDNNQSPVITSTPVTQAEANTLYTYQVIASDPENDTLTYSIESSDGRIKIDKDSGLITWQVPAGSQGERQVKVIVTDIYGTFATQSFRINIKADKPPKFITQPIKIGYLGQKYSYQAIAEDPEGLAVRYYFNTTKPNGITLNAATGLVEWETPQLGKHYVDLWATDGINNTPHHYTLTIIRPLYTAPKITSQPVKTANAAKPYQYDVIATATKPLTYRLLGSVPNGLEINQQSGVIRWSYPVVGSYDITVVADDGQAIDTQTYRLQVAAGDGSINDLPPVITSQPIVIGEADKSYSYAIKAHDPEGQQLTYRLLGTPPAGMTIQRTNGVIVWRQAKAGQYAISTEVSDGKHAVRQDYQLTILPTVSGTGLPPILSAAPMPVGYESVPYTHQFEASDPDGDTLTYYLSGFGLPQGLTLDAQTGLLTWNKPIISNYAIEIMVSDGNHYVRKRYSLVIQAAANKPPKFTSRPVSNIEVGSDYTYQAVAIDPEGEPVTYAFIDSIPLGMKINRQTGFIEWPNATAGQFAIKIVASDGNKHTTQGFTLVVKDSNEAPRFTTKPVTTHVEGSPYRYQVEATDPNNDTVTYRFDQATTPSGMTLDSDTGLLLWPQPVKGRYRLVIVASDGEKEASQTYTLTVTEQLGTNNPPVISSTPVVQGQRGNPYRYQVIASDPENQFLSYSLSGSVPLGLNIDSSLGTVSWDKPVVGRYPVTVVVSDGVHQTEQSYVLTIESNGQNLVPLTLDIYTSSSFVDEGETITITVTPDNISGRLLSRRLWIDGQEVTLDNFGRVQWVASGIGAHQLRATAEDDNEVVEATGVFYVKDPSDSEKPIVRIDKPIDDVKIAEISSPTDIFITVSDANLAGWRLSLKDESRKDSPYLTLVSGNTERNNELIGQLDPTRFENGIYSLNLQATDKGGNANSHKMYVLFTGQMKLGHFGLTFNDVSMDTVGIPLSMQRTYDTRRRHIGGDFGNGWTMAYNNIRLSENGKFGRNWIYQQLGSLLNRRYCSYRNNGDGYVSITTPDGETHNFRAVAEPECTSVQQPLPIVTIKYEAMDGTTGTLVSRDYPGSLRVMTIGGVEGLYPLDGEELVDPNEYRLTTKDDIIYDIEERTGVAHIEKISLPSGHALTFTADGIKHSGGLSLDFHRDNKNRIAKVTKPDDTTITYEYDFNNDLVASVDENGNRTTYSYYQNPPYKHYLKDINDPLGNRAIRNEYGDDGRLTAHIDADGNRIEYTHDVVGRQSMVKDRNGSTTTYIYDGRGNVLSETNGEGETTTHTYDSDDNELSVTDALGNTTTYTYDHRGNQLTETDALGNTTTMTYNGIKMVSETDPLGRTTTNEYFRLHSQYVSDPLLSHTDGAGNKTRFEYTCSRGALSKIIDAEGNISKQTPSCRDGKNYGDTDANGVTRRYRYTAGGHLYEEKTHYSNADGEKVDLVTQHELDNKGNVLKTIYPDGSFEEFRYNAADQLTWQRTKRNYGITYTYTARGEEAKVTNPGASPTEKTYDAEGNLLTEKDEQGLVTTYTYDKANRLIKTTYNDGSTTTQSYYKNGWLKSSTDQRGNTTTYEYDKAGRQTKVTQADGSTTQSEYDAAGQKVASIDARGNRTAYQYDDAGRLVKTTFADGSTVAKTYDKNGRVKTKTDQLGNVTAYDYDPVGRLIKVTDALGNATTYDYDEQGNKTAQTDAEGRVTKWAYDVMGRVVSRTLPGGERESFTYDSAGNVLTHTDFNGDTTTYAYNSSNRKRMETFADGKKNHWGYHFGLVSTIRNATGTITYEYYRADKLRRLKRIVDAKGKAIAYQYDSAGNKTRVTADGVVTDYTYDNLNRLKTVTQNGNVTTYTYDKNGNLATEATGVMTTTYTYDALNRLTQKVATGNGISYTETLTYFANGQIKSKTEKLTDNGTDVQDAAVSYTYDKLGRLTQSLATNPILGNDTVTYTYDKVGNRKTQTTNGVSTAYTYNANDQLLTAGTAAYTYDANGNTLTKTDNGNTASYVYNKQNKLTGVTENAVTTTFSYNPHGLRIGKKTGTDEINYLIDAQSGFGDVVAEYQNGSKTTTYTLGNRRISQTIGSDTHYFGTDNQGSVKFLTDSTGLTDDYSYDSFGVLKNQNGSTDNAFRYTGEQFDKTLNMYNLRARYYAPEIGRFYGLDSYQGRQCKPITLNKYLYAHADAVNNVDPSGYISMLSISYNSNLMTTMRVSASNAFRQGAGRLGGKIMNQMGNKAQKIVKEIVEDCMKPKRILENRKVREGSKRTIDLVVEAENTIHNIEVKNKIPTYGSAALRRLKEQLLEAQNSGSNIHGNIIVVGGERVSDGMLEQTISYLKRANVDTSSVYLFNGFISFAQWAGELYLEECIGF